MQRYKGINGSRVKNDGFRRERGPGRGRARGRHQNLSGNRERDREGEKVNNLTREKERQPDTLDKQILTNKM